MMKVLKVVLACAGLVLFLTQPGRNSRATRPADAKEQPQKSASRRQASAKTLFARNCATCHGSDGRGETVPGKISGVPNLADRKWQESVDEKRMAASITHGRGSMPSFEEKLSQNEIASLVSHVRSLKD
ncbi:MAG TPA: c-type cytochrome [Pyrinomonadaceae bacterium]|nr:c-type cytochrome [Pyrinomonadaceae bacterium]